ncbi:MAG: hypothetical protein HYZ34_15380, partial [Ignavibacteriae bacterium]|nr:hypothetical protein [Ignavibacteriota bacterium]
MRSKILSILLVLLMVGITFTSYAQFSPRKDFIWARSIDGGTMTLDGVLNETEWSKAESLSINYGENAGDPTSGWNIEGGLAPTDPTHATVKFLADPATNMLYLGFDVPDSSIGGKDWAQFDQLLFSIKSRLALHERGGFYLPKEVFAGWGWDATPGIVPTFDNNFASARFSVNGTSNDDAGFDVGYSIELSLRLDSLGYDANDGGGDVLELNFSIWDADWNWPNDPARFSSNKTWWQNPWNNLGNNVARVFVNPGVTVNTAGTLDGPEPDVTIMNGSLFPAPTIDGNLNDGIWSNLSSFDVRFGDPALRATYPSIGKWRAGEWQGGGFPNPVVDPGNAAVKWFFKGDMLYVGIDVTDELVQTDGSDDWLDGIQLSVTIPDEAQRNGDNTMKAVRYGVRVDSQTLGGSKAIWDLTDLVSSGGASYGLQLKGATTVNDPSDIDEGFMVELAIDLTRLGYAAGSANKMVLLGFSYLDGDKFTNSSNDYGTRSWWFREWPWGCAPAWCLLDDDEVIANPQQNFASRNDYIWARATPPVMFTNSGGWLNYDGNMNETEWSEAESLAINYGENAGDPTSGWNIEGGLAPTDPTHATVKFLADPANNDLYLGFNVPDSSIGGKD